MTRKTLGWGNATSRKSRWGDAVSQLTERGKDGNDIATMSGSFDGQRMVPVAQRAAPWQGAPPGPAHNVSRWPE
jgi:hypothetical protein